MSICGIFFHAKAREPRTSFGLKVGNAVHDDMVKKQRFVVDLDVSAEQTAEVVHIPAQGTRAVSDAKLAVSIGYMCWTHESGMHIC